MTESFCAYLQQNKRSGNTWQGTTCETPITPPRMFLDICQTKTPFQISSHNKTCALKFQGIIVIEA